MAILSISIVPTSLFSMKKPQENRSKDQVNEILHNLDQEQDEFIRYVLSTYRIIAFRKTFEDGGIAKTPDYDLFKNEEKENNLEKASQYLNDKIQEGENNINNILGSSSLDDNEKAELVRKMTEAKERQIDINENLELIIKNKDDVRRVRSGMVGMIAWTDDRTDRVSKNFKINRCGHDYRNGDYENLTITDMSRCPICEWYKNNQGEDPYKKPKVTEPAENNNPANRPDNNWLRSYLWPTTKITLYTSCLILAVVLASRLFNLR